MDNAYIQRLVAPSQKKQAGKKLWSVDMDTVWLPFFTATNANGHTQIAREAIGAPLRLQYNDDGTVKFSKNGKPVIRVAKELSEAVTSVRNNFISDLVNYAEETETKNAKKFADETRLCVKAGKPIVADDDAHLRQAIAERTAQQVAEATDAPEPASTPELVNA